MKPSITRWNTTPSQAPAPASAAMRSACSGAPSSSRSITAVPLASPATVISMPVAAAGDAARRAMTASAARRRAMEAGASRIGGHLDADHAVGLGGRLAAGDGVDMFHAADHAAVDGVLPVQEMIVGEVDEELRIRAVGARG